MAKNMHQDNGVKAFRETEAPSRSPRAKSILDVSYSKLWDRPVLLEEKLLKTPGVIHAEINAFSNRIRVEFDSSQTTLDKIKSIIRPRKDS